VTEQPHKSSVLQRDRDYERLLFEWKFLQIDQSFQSLIDLLYFTYICWTAFPMENDFSQRIVWRDSSPKAMYEEARVSRIFNHLRPSRYPIAVVQAIQEQDIVDAVKLAIKEKCRVSVRSGGHSWAAWSVRDDAVLLDLGDYKEVDLDEKTGIVKASPSTTAKMLNDYLIPKGLIFAGGHLPDVGIGGFLLQGGQGWNCRVW
jgi:FAD/FMN-containing dehydrogenase